MKIKYIFGPRSGEVEHVSRETAAPLIAARIAEALEPDLPVQGEPAWKRNSNLPKAGATPKPRREWAVEVSTYSNPENAQIVAIRRDTFRGSFLSETARCTFPPDKVHDRTDHTGRAFCSCFGEPVPADILAEYKRAWRNGASKEQRESEGPRFSNHPDAASDKARITDHSRNTADAARPKPRAF